MIFVLYEEAMKRKMIDLQIGDSDVKVSSAILLLLLCRGTIAFLDSSLRGMYVGAVEHVNGSKRQS